MRILVIDDDEVMRKLVREVLLKDGHQVEMAGSGEAAIPFLKKEVFPIVVTDVRMLDLGGMDVLREVKKRNPESVVILMTGFGSMDGAIEAIREGAFDYISKPFKIDDLKALVKRAADHWESLRSRPKGTQQTGSPALDVSQKGLIGKSAKIIEIYKTLARAALSQSNVLVTGESGTGKELVARAIHENSQRRQKPFVAVNCGALAENLLESELFGHVRGAFTGATHDKKGLFEEANGGTLFLDEIGDVSAPLQIKLLRVLQEGEMKPVGSNETRRVDVRLIAATHRDLGALVSQEKFREDLYYRLKVIEISIPPLRERKEDIPQLVEVFLIRYSEKNGKQISHVSDEAMKYLNGYSWPGNVRELEHSIERAVALTKTSVLYPEDLPLEIREPSSPDLAGTGSGVAGNQPNSLEDIEKLHILRVLQENGYNKSKAADALGIDRATLYRKASRYGIDLRGK
ncbi:MAG: sigma-54-dependent Fis family transcriptional regulator [Bdellovibrionales bacterium]|nr:sigma-54-dependent Fis family transcriptional regulator [Bdellovibrionales bacterium]